MRTVNIASVWVDESSRLRVTPDLEPSEDYRFVYRAAMCVSWDPASRSVFPSSPREWSCAKWFRQLVEAVANEYGTLLVLSRDTEWSGISDEDRAEIVDEDQDARRQERVRVPVSEATMARYVGDDRKREQARELFKAKEWQGVVTVLESLQYPGQMSRADRKRLELARRRADAR